MFVSVLIFAFALTVWFVICILMFWFIYWPEPSDDKNEVRLEAAAIISCAYVGTLIIIIGIISFAFIPWGHGESTWVTPLTVISIGIVWLAPAVWIFGVKPKFSQLE